MENEICDRNILQYSPYSNLGLGDQNAIEKEHNNSEGGENPKINLIFNYKIQSKQLEDTVLM